MSSPVSRTLPRDTDAGCGGAVLLPVGISNCFLKHARLNGTVGIRSRNLRTSSAWLSKAWLSWDRRWRTRRTCHYPLQRASRSLLGFVHAFGPVRLAFPGDSSGTAAVSCLEPERRSGGHMLRVPSRPSPAGLAAVPAALLQPPRLAGFVFGDAEPLCPSLQHGPPPYGLLSVSQSHSRQVGEEACMFIPGDLPQPQPCPPTASHPAPFHPTHRNLSLLLDGAAVSPSLSQNIPHSSRSL